MNEQITRLKEVVAKLRHPENGCPWDLKQTHQSLLPYLIEESYEFMQSVEDGDFQEMEEELGDVLLQVVLHAQLASENNKFSFESVAKKLADKMIHRHPHVFADGDAKTADEVSKKWQELKAENKKKRHAINQAHLAAPALTSSFEIGAKTKELNFDWDDAAQVSYKVEEEWQELKEELVATKINKERAKEEIGDFLFSVAQLARHLDIDPELALRDANKKFVRRFNRIEDMITSEGKNFSDFDQMQLDHYWNRAKGEEK
ncbi:MAG: nucleoside triphosphate pyrophosphohydrolase [Halobacteriovorax sp.]|nr:nucleoside triphosphate pyrophosphohydrolase [Halobacteriovorax sp.]